MADEPIEVAPVEASSAGALAVSCTPAVIDDNLAALEGAVDAMLAPYVGAAIDPADAAQVREGRKCMADLNRMKEPIERERKRVKREYEAPLKAFEARVRAVTSRIDDARAAIKAQVDAADEAFRAARRAALEEEYASVAGPMADVIPFAAVLDERWLNRSTAEPKAASELAAKAAKAVEGYEALAAKELRHKDEVVRAYCESLDLAAALRLEGELAEDDRRMEGFRRAQEAAAAVKAQRAQEEPAAQAAAEAEPVFRWSLSCGFEGTRGLARDLGAALKGLGITGTIKCIGEVRDEQ